MKHKLLIVFVLLASVAAFAQPSWMKKASRSVFTLKTFADDGQLLGSATGVFVSADGTALSLFSPFKGASRAIVIDYAGKEYEVESVLGANDTYDVVKFRVGGMKKGVAAEIGAQHLEVGATGWLLNYKDVKKPLQGSVEKVETFNGDYAFYTVAIPMSDGQAGAPLFGNDGRVAGLAQVPMGDNDQVCYAVSARFADSLKTTGLSINDPVLRATKVKKALPADEQQALLALYIGSAQLDSAAYAGLIADFIQQFPTSSEGYQYRAQEYVRTRRFADADADMSKALSVAARPDEVHYAFARMICQVVLADSAACQSWTLDKALDEARRASAERPLAVYTQQQGHILYAQKKYTEAYACYAQLFDSLVVRPDIFLEAARCQQMMGDTVAYLALLDRMVDHFSKPYLREAAPYLLVRAQANLDAGHTRKAVADLNDYERLMKAQLNDHFYYVRFQAEVGGRLFQQALNDIDVAISMNTTNDLYLAEKASLLVRVGYLDEAMETARECIQLAPDHSDGYLFLGLAQCLKGEKEEGVHNLQRAGELGDPQAQGLIEKYR